MKQWKKNAERTRRRRMRNRKMVRGTLAASSSLDLERAKNLISKYGGNCDAAKAVGLDIATKAKDQGLVEVRLDRGPYKYHGRVKALADGAREGGLVF